MDNGRSSQTKNTISQPFFTTGAGAPIEDETISETNDNLEYSNRSAQWANAVERDPRNMGSSAINSRANHENSESQHHNPEMGEIIEISMPPGEEVISDKKETFQPNVKSATPAAYMDVTEFGEKGKRISKNTLRHVEHEVSEYRRGKISPEELDDLEWEDKKAYLDHSFQRKIAA